MKYIFDHFERGTHSQSHFLTLFKLLLTSISIKVDNNGSSFKIVFVFIFLLIHVYFKIVEKWIYIGDLAYVRTLTKGLQLDERKLFIIRLYVYNYL